MKHKLYKLSNNNYTMAKSIKMKPLILLISIFFIIFSINSVLGVEL
jgi:hypothetical protein